MSKITLPGAAPVSSAGNEALTVNPGYQKVSAANPWEVLLPANLKRGRFLTQMPTLDDSGAANTNILFLFRGNIAPGNTAKGIELKAGALYENDGIQCSNKIWWRTSAIFGNPYTFYFEEG